MYLIKRFYLLVVALLLTLNLSAQSVKTKLENYSNIVSIEKMDNNEMFQEAFTIYVEQPLDHNDPSKGVFKQRVIISHLDYSANTVIVTEGYKADYAARKSYVNELTKILNTNQIVIEHRFFSKSMPTPIEWEYLTVENAAADQHVVIDIIKEIYTAKTITTGISKGGMTALYHRTLYPNDVDVTVPYVAPVNFAVADKRHAKFIANTIATEKEREAVKNFQIEVLKRRETLMPMFKEMCDKNSLKFRVDLDAIYDYSTLEYSFSFWQWGNNIDIIPASTASDKEIFDHFIKLASPDYFKIEQDLNGIGSFFVQARRELGYYAYDLKPFKRWLSIKCSDNYVEELFLNEDNTFKYSNKQSKATESYIKKSATNVMLIYGEWDPWSASAVESGSNSGVVKFVDPKGSHRARINTLPEELRAEAIKTLNEWLSK